MECAVKMLTEAPQSMSSASSSLIYNEAKVLAALTHPNIVKCYDSGLGCITYPEVTGSKKQRYRVHYLVVERFHNGSLFDMLTHGRLSNEFLQDAFAKLAMAVGYLHSKGYVHRDIKPENVMLDSLYNTKLIDFGLATPRIDQYGDPVSYLTCGSRPYWPPEIFLAKYPYGYLPDKADIFELGITLCMMKYGIWANDDAYACQTYEDLCERLISFQEDRYWRYLDQLIGAPPDYELTDLLRSMLAPNPANRPTTEDILRHPWLAQLRPFLALC